MIKKNICVILLALSLILCSCAKLSGQSSKNLPDIYGPELYSGSIIARDNCFHIISIMSNRNLSTMSGLELESSGGSFEYTGTIEDQQFEYKGYKLYSLILVFNNIAFDGNNSIDINKINVTLSEGSQYSFSPYMCQLIYLNSSGLEYNFDKLYFLGSPTKLPYDMDEVPFDLHANEDVSLDSIEFTNDDIVQIEYFNMTLPLMLEEGIDKNIRIIIDATKLDKYKSYVFETIVYYLAEGQNYFLMPAMRTIYNEFGTDNIKAYFNEVISN